MGLVTTSRVGTSQEWWWSVSCKAGELTPDRLVGNCLSRAAREPAGGGVSGQLEVFSYDEWKLGQRFVTTARDVPLYVASSGGRMLTNSL